MPKFLLRLVFLAVMALGGATVASAAEKSRVLVLTDIGNEPDDAESLVRFLVYVNEFDVEGLVATTSRHQRTTVRRDLIEERVRAYGRVLPNLRSHAPGYPDERALLDMIKVGRPEYGIAAVGAGKDTEGSRWVISTVDKADSRPVWVLVWGGAVDLAQALWTVRETRTPQEVEAFVKKLRVYSISDQDDAAPWVRRTFPDIFWIVSLHAENHYELSTWSGISGEAWYHFEGPDSHLISNAWLATNVRKGPLGELYPEWKYIMEGDTPSFLYLIPNGLGLPERPDYGSWGGRYGRVWSGDNIWTDTTDMVEDYKGVMRQTNQATIWRWREAYQNDFAARMKWTLTSNRKAANHRPILSLNGQPGLEPVRISVKPGQEIRLDAAGSSDPDGDAVRYHWFQYREAGVQNRAAEAKLSVSEGQSTTFTAPTRNGEYHIILQARDDGVLPLYSYRRAIISVAP